jgi:hypothetical protein
MLQQVDKLLCESWNERMWADGEPIDPSPTIDQAVHGGFGRDDVMMEKDDGGEAGRCRRKFSDAWVPPISVYQSQ